MKWKDYLPISPTYTFKMAMPGRIFNASLRRSTQSLACSSSSAPSRVVCRSIRQASSSSSVQQEAQRTSSTSASSSPLPASEIDESPMKHDLPSPFEPAKYHPRTHSHHVASLQLQSFGHAQEVEDLDFFSDFAIRAGYALGIPLSKVHSLKTTKSLWTVPRGPFVHKKSQENFERRTNRRLIKVWDSDFEVVEKWLQFLRIHAMEGVGMRAEVFRHVPVGFGTQMLAASTAQLRSIPENVSEASDATLRASQADVDKIQQLAKGIVKEELEQQAQDDAQDASEATAIEEEAKPAEEKKE